MAEHTVALFAEDSGHEQVLSAIIARMARESGVGLSLSARSVRGGHGKAITEFREYQRDIRSGREFLPDLLVVAIDSNCKGLTAHRKELSEAIDSETMPAECFVLATPDPHVERWLLLDSAAFKTVLGKGCSAPDLKCERRRYKRLLAEAVQAAGVEPLLGGLEHAEDLVNAMDLERMERSDPSLGQFLTDMRRKLQEWKREGSGRG